MSIKRSTVMRMVLLTSGCAMLAAALIQLVRQQLVSGFLLAFVALSTLALSEMEVDYATRYTARTLLRNGMTRRSPISTLGKLCSITSYFALAAAFISWVALN